MRKIIYLLLLVLFIPTIHATVISNTSIWSVNYVIGSALPQTKIKFTNSDVNNSINLGLSVSGDTPSWITLSSDPLAIGYFVGMDVFRIGAMKKNNVVF